MTAPASASIFAQAFADRILVFDGAMGTMIQSRDLSAEDFGGAQLEGCNENLNLTRPDVIREIHEAYLDAGADVISTNTFGCAPYVLAEYGLAERCHDIVLAAARLASDRRGQPVHRRSPALCTRGHGAGNADHHGDRRRHFRRGAGRLLPSRPAR